MIPMILWMSLTSISQATPAPAVTPGIYAGIECGSKGIKAIAVQLDADPAVPVKVLGQKVINTTLMEIDANGIRPQALTETVQAVDQLQQWLRKEHQVPTERVRIIASSAVAQLPGFDRLQAAVQSQLNRPLSGLSERAEVQSLLDGLALRSGDAPEASIDIGSGNTKGGFLDSTGTLKFFALPMGSVSTTMALRAIEPLTPQTVADFQKAEIAPKLNEALLPIRNQKNLTEITMTGGAVWAMTTILFPEQIQQERVRFTVADLNRYAAAMTAKPGELPQVALESISDPKIREAARKELTTVLRVFTPENLLAGSVLLQSLGNSLQDRNPQFTFRRSGLNAWILAQAIQSSGKAIPQGSSKPQPQPGISSRSQKPNDAPAAAPTPVPAPTPAPMDPILDAAPHAMPCPCPTPMLGAVPYSPPMLWYAPVPTSGRIPFHCPPTLVWVTSPAVPCAPPVMWTVRPVRPRHCR